LRHSSTPKGGRAQVAEAVADGRAEIGNTNLTELLPHKGAKVIGPIPEPLGLVITYVGGSLLSAPVDRRKTDDDAAGAMRILLAERPWKFIEREAAGRVPSYRSLLAIRRRLKGSRPRAKPSLTKRYQRSRLTTGPEKAD
jgi:hypothetical protein